MQHVSIETDSEANWTPEGTDSKSHQIS